MKLINEQANKYQELINKAVPNKFDNYISLSLGDVRANWGEREYEWDSPEFIYIGRIPTDQGLMYAAYDNVNDDLVLSKTFRKISYGVALPGRRD